MAYVDPIDPVTPAFDADLGEGDDRIRELKRALIERLETLIVAIDDDPLVFIAGIIPGTALEDGGVTYAKIQDVSATDMLLGRSTAGAGVIEEIAATAAGRALLDDADAEAQRTTLGLGDLAVLDEADILPIGIDDIPDDLITLAKLGYNGGAQHSQATGQSLADGVATLIAGGTINHDNGGYRTSGTRFTVPAGFDGWHFIGITVQWASNATGYRRLYIRKNGVDVIAGQQSGDMSGDAYQSVSVMDDAVATDYYEFLGLQTSTGALDIDGVIRAQIRLLAP